MLGINNVYARLLYTIYKTWSDIVQIINGLIFFFALLFGIEAPINSTHADIAINTKTIELIYLNIETPFM